MPIDRPAPGPHEHPMSSPNLPPLPWSVAAGSHVAHFYETRDEWRAVMVPWLYQGLRAGEKCVYVMNAGRDWMDAREELIAAGIDVREALESGRLEIREGCRDPRDLQGGLDAALAGVPGSWRSVRWGGDMLWARERVPSSGTLMSFESSMNTLCEHPVAFFCQYDLTRFPGYVIMDVLRTHPQSIIDGKLHTTPFHQPDAAFQSALRAREASRDVPW